MTIGREHMNLEGYLDEKISGITKLLDRQLPLGYENEMRSYLEQASLPQDVGHQLSYLLAVSHGVYFALNVHDIVTVSVRKKFRRLPNIHLSGILGIVTILGELCLSVSIQEILALPNNSSQKLSLAFPRTIMMQSGKDKLSFDVDHVFDVIWFKEQDVKSLPSSMQGKSKEMAQGYLNWKQEQVLLIETPYLFETVQNWMKH